MKYIITLLVALLMSVASYADVVREGNTFKVTTTSVNQDIKTYLNWQDKDGIIYPIYITKKGACYVKRISKKTNKEYKHYLPKEIQLQIAKELGVLTPEGVKEIIQQ